VTCVSLWAAVGVIRGSGEGGEGPVKEMTYRALAIRDGLRGQQPHRGLEVGLDRSCEEVELRRHLPRPLQQPLQLLLLCRRLALLLLRSILSNVRPAASRPAEVASEGCWSESSNLEEQASDLEEQTSNLEEQASNLEEQMFT